MSLLEKTTKIVKKNKLHNFTPSDGGFSTRIKTTIFKTITT
jgi:hypothetical protein